MIYLAFLIFTFLILIFAFYEWQYFMIFSPTFYREEKLCDFCSVLSAKTEDGVTLEGALYEPDNASTTLLMFVGRSHDAVGLINKLAETYPNTRIVTFNYRSYGKSEGKIDEQNLFNDALFIANLVQKNYGDFSLLGYSLGTSVAAFVASNIKVKVVFLVGAFDSIASLAKSRFVDKGFIPYINLANIFRYKFRTYKYVQDIDSPTYLFASRDDETVYVENSRMLKENVKNLAYYIELDGLSHKDLLWDRAVTEVIKENIQ